MYKVYTRFYSEQEKLLVWKCSAEYTTFHDAIHTAYTVLEADNIRLYSFPYEDEPNSYHKLVGSRNYVDCMKPNPCNIQIRKDGKLIPWRNV